MTYQPDFQKRSTKIACWIVNDVMDKFMDVFPFFILLGAVAFTFAVDWLLGIEKDIKSSNVGAEGEIIYVPIMAFGLFISLLLSYCVIRFIRFIARLIDRSYHDWYFGIERKS